MQCIGGINHHNSSRSREWVVVVVVMVERVSVDDKFVSNRSVPSCWSTSIYPKSISTQFSNFSAHLVMSIALFPSLFSLWATVFITLYTEVDGRETLSSGPRFYNQYHRPAVHHGPPFPSIILIRSGAHVNMSLRFVLHLSIKPVFGGFVVCTFSEFMYK